MTRLLLIFTLIALAYLQFFWMPNARVQWTNVMAGWPVLLLTVLATMTLISLIGRVVKGPDTQEADREKIRTLQEQLSQLTVENIQAIQEKDHYLHKLFDSRHYEEAMQRKAAADYEKQIKQLTQERDEAIEKAKHEEYCRKNAMETANRRIKKIKRELSQGT